MWPENSQTERLVSRARSGDANAVNELVERHRNAVHHLVRMRLDRQIQQRVDASDIVQEVLIEANRRLREYLDNPQMPFHLWVRHIARDRIIDAHRRHRGSAKRSVDREQAGFNAGSSPSSVVLLRELQDRGRSPISEVISNELAAVVENAITQLDEIDAEVIIMRNYEQLTNQEVAQALDLSEPAASMRYLRAIRRLRELMQDHL